MSALPTDTLAAVLEALRTHRNARRAAELVGVNPTTAWRIAKKHGIALISLSEHMRARRFEPAFVAKQVPAVRDGARRWLKAQHAKPKFHKKSIEAARRNLTRLNLNPAFRHASSERLKRLHEDPAFGAKLDAARRAARKRKKALLRENAIAASERLNRLIHDDSSSRVRDAAASRPARNRGFAIAPILYLLGLIGVGAGVLFSGYSQILRSNQTMSNTLAAKNDMQGTATTLAASSWLSTDQTLLCPPLVGSNSPSTPSVKCSTAVGAITVGTSFASTTAANLPANYASVSSTGSPVEVGVFKAGSGAKVLDPWGHYYIYCRWENSIGTANALMVISAGANGKVETKCGDTVAGGDDLFVVWTTAVTQNRASVWQTTISGTAVTGAQFGAVGTQINVDTAGDLTVPGALTVTGNSTTAIGTGGLTVTGAASLNGGLSATSGSFASGVTSTTGNFSSTLNVSGLTTLSSLSAGTSTLSALTVTGNAAVGGTLGVTGASTLGTLSAGTSMLTGLSVSGGSYFGGTANTSNTGINIGTTFTASGSSTPLLTVGKPVGSPATYPFTVDQFGAVTGSTFTGNLSGNQSGGSVSATTLAASGAATLSSTLGVTGITTLIGALNGSSAVFSGNVQAATFTGTMSIGGGGVTLSGVIPISNGGTGQTSAGNALSALFSGTGTISQMIPGADLVNNSVTTTQLNTTGVAAGTYSSVTVGLDGRITSGTVSAGSASSITDGTGDSITIGTSGGITYTIGSSVQGNWTTTGLMVGSSTVALDKLDVYGGVAIGTGYAGVTTAPTNGLIVQGQVAIGTSTPSGALNVSGTVTATTLSGAHTGSGAGLTGIGTASLGGITGTASGTTFLAGNGAWTALTAAALPALTSTDIWVGNGSNVATATATTGTGNVVMSASPTLTGTITGGTFSGSGALLTGIGTASLGGITGSPSSTTYLRGDGTWGTVGGTLSGGVANYIPLWTSSTVIGTSNIYQSGSSIGIGSTSPRSLLDVAGTVYATTFSGSGASLTAIGTSNLTTITGSPSSTTYLRGDGTWGAPTGNGGITVATSTITSGATTKVLYDNAGVLGEYTITGTGNVVMSASPTLTGTVAGATSTWTGSVAIGTTTTSGALNVNGTVTATTFSGSGASLTGIGTSNMSGITGAASSTTFLAGNGVWTALTTAALPSLTSTDVWVGNGSNVATATATTGTGNVVMSASPTLSGTITGGTFSGTFSGSGASLTSLNASNLSSGTVPTTQLGSGTANSSTYLRGDGTWATGGSGTVAGSGATNYVAKFTSSSAVGSSLLYDSGTAVGISTATPTSTLTVNGTQALQFGTDYSTATATQSDVAINTASAVRYTGAGSVTFYGIAAGNAGQILYLTNAATSTNTLTLSNQSGSDSTAASRIITGSGADMVLANNSSAVLQYDGAASRWRVIGGSGSQWTTSGSDIYYSAGNVAIGTSAISGALNVNGTATATTFSGSGASLTSIGTASLGGITGSPSSTTYLRGDGTWATTSGVTSSTAGQVAYFQATGATVIGTSTITISSGEVGVGQSSPAAQLDILATSAIAALNLAGTAPASVTNAAGTAATSLITGTGATGGAVVANTNSVFRGGTGGGLSLTGGVGGARSGSGNSITSFAGAGGSFTFAGGLGGNDTSTRGRGGPGGGFNFTGGTGGSSSATSNGVGGSSNIFGGTGGTGTISTVAGGGGGSFNGGGGGGGVNTSTGNGGSGGGASLSGGAGGSPTSSPGIGGAGGGVNITGGGGGGPAGAAAGAGGGVWINGGLGGNGNGAGSPIAGAGGTLTLAGGNAGGSTGDSTSTGGSVTLDAGTGNTGVNGSITIGGTNAAGVTIGNATNNSPVTFATGTGNFALNTSQLFVTGSSGNVGIGTATPSTALWVNGTATATTFSGSGASLTGIGTASLGGITGTPSSTTYLRGDGTWTTPAGGGLTVATSTIASGATTKVLYDNAGVLGEYTISGTGNVVMSASPTLTGTITAAAGNFSGNVGIGTTTPSALLDVRTAANRHFAARDNASGTQILGMTDGAASYAGLLIDGSTLALNTASGGNVGVGTATPGASTKLNVNGRGLFTGGVNDPGDSSAAGVAIAYDGTYGLIDAVQTGIAAKPLKINPSQGNTLINPAGGSVGIGTTSPASLLDLYASQPNVQLSPSAYGTTNYNSYFGSMSGSQGVLQLGNNSVNYIVAGNTAAGGYLNFVVNNSNAFPNTPNGTTAMTILASGNVGIGTTNPVFDGNGSMYVAVNNSTAHAFSELAVGGNATTAGDYVGALEFYNSSLGASDQRTAAIFSRTGGATNSGDIEFFTKNAGATVTAMNITAAGNVGIGNTSPAYKLDITGNIQFSPSDDGVSGQTPVIFLKDTYDNPLTAGGWSYKQISFTNSTGGNVWQLGYTQPYMYFAVNGTTPNLVINNSGNVGIGTTSPSTALQVTGTVTATQFVGGGAGLTGVTATPSFSGLTTSAFCTATNATTIGCSTASTGTGSVVLAAAPTLSGILTGGTSIWNGGSSSNWASVNIGGALSINTNGTIYSYTGMCTGNNSGGCTSTAGVVIWPTGSNVYGSTYLTGSGNSYFNGGSVGIGNTSPSYPLDVTGNARITGTLYTSGSSSTYGSVTIDGIKNGWTGINFKTAGTNYATLMVSGDTVGFYNAAVSGWDWYWTAGTLTTGTVPVANLSGTLAVANGGTGVTTSTGTGSVVLSASPTLSGTITGGTFSGSGASLTSLNAGNISSGTLAVARGGTGVTTSTGSGNTVLSSAPTLTGLTVNNGGTHGIVAYGPGSGSSYYAVYGENGSYYAGLGRADGYAIVGSGASYITGTGYFGSTLTVGADTYSNNYFHNSDRRLKDDIKPIAGLAIVDKLNGVTFTWKKDGKPSAGVIAQDVETVMPESVATDKNGMKSVSYDTLIAPIIEAVKELHNLFNTDHDVIAKLQADNDNLRAANDNEAAQIKTLTARLDALEAARR